jgi:hypothetical protein
MTEEEKETLQYRFSGYQLPLIQLDETGPAYVYLTPHPYFYNQPVYWQGAYFRYTPAGRIAMSSQTYPLLPLDES